MDGWWIGVFFVGLRYRYVISQDSCISDYALTHPLFIPMIFFFVPSTSSRHVLVRGDIHTAGLIVLSLSTPPITINSQPRVIWSMVLFFNIDSASDILIQILIAFARLSSSQLIDFR